MRSFWNEPFLWIHLAGLAAVPIALEVVWWGLAVGDPILPVWLEWSLLAIVGIAPVLWMQLTRPFDIFSILVLALKPEQLTVEQRRLLSLFKKKNNRVLIIAAAVLMLWVLWQIYRAAPIAAAVAPFSPSWRIIGLLLAGLAFLGSNLFLQVPLSVLQVLLTSESEFAATEPYAIEKLSQDFTIPGLKVNKILPIALTQTASQSEPEVTDSASESEN
ncbi:MAG: low-complexity tail membrane protein [Coleofasciculaceae cyanobacterium]